MLCNDGGTLAAPNMEAPIGVKGLVRATLDPLRGTMVDILYWQLGTDPYFENSFLGNEQPEDCLLAL